MKKLLDLGRLAARYAVSGGAAAIVDLGAFAVLHHVLTMGILPAAIASYGLAVVFNYVFSSAFVYKTPLSGRRFVVFFLAASLGLGVNTGVTLASVSVLDAPAILAKIIGIGVAFGFNFLLATFVVFRPARTSGGNA